MTRYLGIDHGTRRIGLAIGDDVTGIASPVGMVSMEGEPRAQAQAVAQKAQPYAFDAVVIGLPLNMDDSEGPQARTVRAFGDALAQLTGVPVIYHDERLSSFEAEHRMRPAEWTRQARSKRVDAVAAQLVLQSFLDTHPHGQ